MKNVEYVRNLHSNYERIHLEKKPEENRYQYCILTRGGIKGLLPCSLRYLDGEAYLYFDISSMQNIAQVHQKSNVTREWLLSFMDGVRHLQRELARFLLQEDNVVWFPDQIFQDLESNAFSFLFFPYYEGDNGWMRLMSFLVERVNYEDEKLVEVVYHMYEQSEKVGIIYLQEQIFKDVAVLEHVPESETVNKEQTMEAKVNNSEIQDKNKADSGQDLKQDNDKKQGEEDNRERIVRQEDELQGERGDREKGKKRFSIFEAKKGKKSREQEIRDTYRETSQQIMAYGVAEESNYEEYGRTCFISEKPIKKEAVHRLYYGDGRKASDLEIPNLIIGKYKDKVDLFLEDDSISRMHARILKDPSGACYLEDSNSTNGSFINGERLQPYERRELKPGDELRFGNQTLLYR